MNYQRSSSWCDYRRVHSHQNCPLIDFVVILLAIYADRMLLVACWCRCLNKLWKRWRPSSDHMNLWAMLLFLCFRLQSSYFLWNSIIPHLFRGVKVLLLIIGWEEWAQIAVVVDWVWLMSFYSIGYLNYDRWILIVDRVGCASFWSLPIIYNHLHLQSFCAVVLLVCFWKDWGTS